MSALEAIRKALAESSHVSVIWQLRVDPKPNKHEWDQHIIFFLTRRSEDKSVDAVLTDLEAFIGITPVTRYPYLSRTCFAALQYAEKIGFRYSRPDEVKYLLIDDELPNLQVPVAIETTVLRKINLRLFASFEEANDAFECAKAFYAGD